MGKTAISWAIQVPLHRLQEFSLLTDAERTAVLALGEAPICLPPQVELRREGDRATSFYLLLNGWALSSITLPTGGRQVLKVHLPGDALGTPSMSADNAIETLTTVTEALVSEVPLARFGRLLVDHPRVGANFLLSVQRERVTLMDQLVSIGRTSAEARLAAFLLDLADRLAPLGAVQADAFQLLLTQEQIADLLGLTAIHVNRTMRLLKSKGLIARERRLLQILDRPALAELAARPIRPVRSDLSWLPASCDTQ